MTTVLDLANQIRIQAHANRLANRRLHEAMRPLTHEDFHATRTSFFPSLAQTLNHILVVDLYYIGALHRDAGIAATFRNFVPFEDLASLSERQRQSDERLIAWCDAADATALSQLVDMDRGTTVRRDRAAHVLAHLFMHQTHHRGQAHAMLSGTQVAPPQLDDFLMPSDAQFREADMRALGWQEGRVYGALESD
jgi:uncharacterized damage-inducible protein DinB